MEHLKSVSISVCAIALMFGIFKNILPGNKYEKYIRFTMTLIFLFMIISGIRTVVLNDNLVMDSAKMIETNTNVDKQLEYHIKEYLNEQLLSENIDLRCHNVSVVVKGENYYISEIQVSDDSVEGINRLIEITGLKKEQIHVVA